MIPWLKRAAVGIVVALLVAWLLVNVVLNLPAVKNRVSGLAAQVVGMPLEVGRIVATPWGTLALKDLRFEIATEREDKDEIPPFLSGRELRFRVSPFSLFSRNIRFRSVELSDPVISLVRTRDEGFLVPGRRGGAVGPGQRADGEVPMAEAAQSEGKGRAAARGDASPAEAPGVLAGAAGSVNVPAGADGANPALVRPIVMQFGSRILHFSELKLGSGTMQVISLEGGEDLLRVEGIKMTVDVGPEPRKEGSFEAERAVLFESIEATSLRSKVAAVGPWFDFTEFEASVEGGTATGAMRASVFLAGVPFLAGFRLEEVPAAPLVSRLAPVLAIDDGMLGGEIRLYGRLKMPSTYRGAGQFGVNGGHWGSSSLLAPLNADALSDVAFDDMFAKFTIGNGIVGFSDVRLGSPDIAVAGRGGINFQGAMKLAMRLYVSADVYGAIESIEKRLPAGYRFGYAPFEGSSERFYRDYQITGPVQDPLINFWDPGKGKSAAELKAEMFEIIKSIAEAELQRAGAR